MNEIDFSKLVMEKYKDSGDTMINIIVKLSSELGIEIENIRNYLTEGIVEMLEKEARSLNLLEKTPEDRMTYDIF